MSQDDSYSAMLAFEGIEHEAASHKVRRRKDVNHVKLHRCRVVIDDLSKFAVMSGTLSES